MENNGFFIIWIFQLEKYSIFRNNGFFEIKKMYRKIYNQNSNYQKYVIFHKKKTLQWKTFELKQSKLWKVLFFKTISFLVVALKCK